VPARPEVKLRRWWARRWQSDAVILYRFLTGPDNETFFRQVTRALNDGWALAGPASMTFDPERGRVACGQPITKEVPGVTYSEQIAFSEY